MKYPEDYINKIINGDCLDVLKILPDNFVDSICCDPPYELGFMGKSWDNTGIANNVEMWKECLRVLKPGGHLLAFSGTRTYHRMAVAIEDAGFEVRDMIEWVYSTGFPKSLNVKKQLEKQYGTKALSKHQLRPVSETNLSQTKSAKKEQGEVLQSGLSEQSLHETMQGEEPKESTQNGKKSSVERRSNLQTTKGELQKCPLCEMSEGIYTDGKERRIHNGTQISNGETPEQIINQNRGSSSHRPQPEQQLNCKLNALCEQHLTQEIRRYDGIGTALKPAHEPICMARKPLAEKTVAENCLKWGTGGINIDESRVGTGDRRMCGTTNKSGETSYVLGAREETRTKLGRFPANLILSDSEEVRECFPDTVGAGNKIGTPRKSGTFFTDEQTQVNMKYDNGGSTARFFKSIKTEEQSVAGELQLKNQTTKSNQKACKSVEMLSNRNYVSQKISSYNSNISYCKQNVNLIFVKSIIYQAKASKSERNKGCEGLEEKEYPKEHFSSERLNDLRMENEQKRNPNTNNHPTVKPIALMEYLIKMVTPKSGIVLDPFAGSGSTLVAAKQNGFQYIGIELTEEYIPIIEARLKSVKQSLPL